MKYIILVVIILLSISYSHFILHINFNDEKTIRLNIKLLFNIIKINIKIYPKENKKNKRKIKIPFNFKSLYKEKDNLVNLLKKIKVEEVYSDIYFGNENPYITTSIIVLINAIYANISNICKYNQIYLNLSTNFTQNDIKANIKIHIKFRLVSMFKSIFIFIRMIKDNSKDGDKDENNKFNTKHYGDDY